MANTTVKNSEAVPRSTARSKSAAWTGAFLLLLALLLSGLGCTKDNLSPSRSTAFIPDTLEARELGMEHKATPVKEGYEVTNLVSDVAEYNPRLLDPNLVNAWGIAIGPTGAFWISAGYTSLSVIYDDEGNTLRAPVTMQGEPTGQVYNGTSGFMIPGMGAARFIFVTEQGTIAAWRSGNTAMTVVDRLAQGASYTGVELASDGSGNFLYVANVGQGKVDVFDQNWNYVNSKPFNDPSLPAGAKPFNVRLIDNQLYVTYVGPGGGYVNTFRTNGSFVRRFASGATLNEPWGITSTPPKFGLGQAILVGNFGDGRINIYNKNGQFKGQLGDEDGEAITIEGLWALTFVPDAFSGGDNLDLYFTAGPDDETHGIFGEIEHEE